ERVSPASVIAPSSHLRIYFLCSGSLLAKCTEEATLTRPPLPQAPPSAQQPASTQLPLPAQGAAASRSRQLYAGDRSDLRVFPPLQIPMMRGATCASRLATTDSSQAYCS